MSKKRKTKRKVGVFLVIVLACTIWFPVGSFAEKSNENRIVECQEYVGLQQNEMHELCKKSNEYASKKEVTIEGVHIESKVYDGECAKLAGEMKIMCGDQDVTSKFQRGEILYHYYKIKGDKKVLIDETPKNAGQYILNIVVGNDDYYGSKTFPFVVKHKKISVGGVDACDRTYEEGNCQVAIANVEFEGIVEGETSLKYHARGNLSSDCAGGKRKVVYDIALDEEGNYIFEEGTFSISGETIVNIAKALGIEFKKENDNFKYNERGERTHVFDFKEMPKGMKEEIVFGKGTLIDDPEDIIDAWSVDEKNGEVTYSFTKELKPSSHAVLSIKIDSKNYETSNAKLEINAYGDEPAPKPDIPTNDVEINDDGTKADGNVIKTGDEIAIWAMIGIMAFMVITCLVIVCICKIEKMTKMVQKRNRREL